MSDTTTTPLPRYITRDMHMRLHAQGMFAALKALVEAVEQQFPETAEWEAGPVAEARAVIRSVERVA